MAVATLPTWRPLHDDPAITRSPGHPALTESLDRRVADGMPLPQPPHTAGIQQHSILPPSSSSLSSYDDSAAASPGDSSHDPSGLGSLVKRRRSSKGKILPIDLKQSASQPHLRNLANADAAKPPSPTNDKRRNKLGYHRTSVACTHCRRRKIRCLLAPDDPQGRCSNCIRLKKECNFYPVDQGEPNKAGNLAGTGTVTRGYGSLPLGASAGGLPLPSNQKDLGLQSSDLGPSPYYPTLSGLGPDQWAIPHFGASSSALRQSVSGEASPGYWSQVPSSVSSSISSRSNVPGILPSSPDNAFPYSQSQMPWAGQRSVSFGHIENMPQYQQYGLGQQPLGVNSSYSFPLQQLNSSGRSVEGTALGETVPASLPSSTLASQMQPGTYQVQPWDHYHNQAQSNQYSPDSSRVSFNGAPWSVPLDGVDRVEADSPHHPPSQQR